MIGQRPVVAIVPARGGSKGIPRKNLALLGGRSLLERALDVARAVARIDRVIVSTDDEEIAGVARSAGAEVHLRPVELATDTAKVIDAIRHLCETMLDAAGGEDALLVLLEPTCPFRLPADVDACLDKLAAGDCDAVATFAPAAVNPWRTWKLDGDRPSVFVEGADPWQPRQKLPPAYQLSGAAYAFKRANLRDPAREILSGEVRAVVLPAERSVDIDTPLDLAAAEAMIAGDVPGA